MALLVARWISKPVERLTAAARRMEGGDLTVRVEPSGGAELEGLADSFNAMAAAIDRNEEVRRRMVTDVAHELRAPLTNLRCELESIQDGLTEASAERIASLHDEVMHLSALVEDLQDLSLADAGKLEVNAQRVNVAEVVRRAIAGMAVPIAVKGDEDVFVTADPRRVVEILTHLVWNAIVAQGRPTEDDEIGIEGEGSGPGVVSRVVDHGL